MKTLSALVLLSALAGTAAAAPAGKGAVLSATVLDDGGEPVEGAVVFLLEPAGKPAAGSKAREMVTDEQAFQPGFLHVPAGSTVSFPNRDDVHHHVYSFSKAKQFNSKLYKGGDAPEIVFDQPGVVKIGCNIHDWMRGVILVTPDKHAAETGEDGKAELRLPSSGPAKVAVYHELLRGSPERTAMEVKFAGGRAAQTWKVKLKGRPSKKPKKKVYY